MTEEDLRLELSKIRNQQQQWHEEITLKRDEYLLREQHWFWQRGFWIAISSVALTTLVLKFT